MSAIKDKMCDGLVQRRLISALLGGNRILVKEARRTRDRAKRTCIKAIKRDIYC